MNDILELFSIAGKIDLKGVDEANKDLDKLDGKGKSTAGKIGGFAKKVGKGAAIIGTAAVAAGTAAFAMTKKVTDGFDNIAKTSTKMGITTDAYQEMDYWASQNGISSQNMEKAVGRLNQRIGMAADGNEKYGSALEKLGVDMDAVKDGTISTEDAMYQSISALSEMESETDKAALASELFGTKLGRELMPALQDGSLSLEDAKKKAEELGIVIEEDTLHAAEEFNDTWDDLTRMMGAFGQKIFAKLMPAFQTMMDWVIDHMPQIQAVFENVFNAIGVVFDVAREWVQKLMSILGEWFRNNEEGLLGLWEVYQKYFTMIWDYVQEAFDFIKDIVMTVMPVIADFIGEMLGKILEFWNENGEQIIQAVQNVFEFVKSIIEFIMPVIIFIVQDAWNAVKNVISGALDVIMGVIKFFSSLFTGDWSGLWDSIKQILSGAVQLLWGLVNLWFVGKMLKVGKTFIKLFKGVFTKGWKFITNLFTKSVGKVKNVVSTGFNAVKSIISKVMNGVKSVISSIWNGIKNVISNVVNSIKSTITSRFNAIKSTATRIFNAVKDKMVKPVQKARDLIKTAIDKVKGFFSGLKLKFPKIKMPKLPKFSLKGKFSLKPPSVPKIGVNWNAKGGIFNKPTVFNTANAGLQGVGEAGSEAILPLNNKTLGSIGSMIAKTMPGQNNNVHFKELLDATIKQNEELNKTNKLLLKILRKDDDNTLDGKSIKKNIDHRMAMELGW